MKEMIQFKQQRELGGILGDVFKFLRLNWKVLFGLILKYAGPALLILVLSFIVYIQGISGFMENLYGDFGSQPSFDTMIVMLIAILFLFISIVAYYGLLYGVVMFSIKSYMNNNGEINKEEVGNNLKEKFWGLIGMSSLTTIMVGFGLALCGIPGIYLGTVLFAVYGVYVFENRSVTDSISYCFELIKGEWWITFATLLVAGIVYYLFTLIFQVPATIYSLGNQFMNIETISNDPSEMFDIGYIILNVISVIGQYLLYTFMVLTSAFIYFNLNEKKNFTGTIETIESLGKREE